MGGSPSMCCSDGDAGSGVVVLDERKLNELGGAATLGTQENTPVKPYAASTDPASVRKVSNTAVAAPALKTPRQAQPKERPRPVVVRQNSDDIPDLEEDEVSAMRNGASTTARGRRHAVAAEAMTEEQIAGFVKPEFHKDVTSTSRIKRILQQNDRSRALFGHLSPMSLDDAIRAFEEVNPAMNTVIMRQGEEAEYFYALDMGTVELHSGGIPVAEGDEARKRTSMHGDLPDRETSLASDHSGKRKEGRKSSLVPSPRKSAKDVKPSRSSAIARSNSPKKERTLSDGQVFGELALLHPGLRSETAIVTSRECKLWRLTREAYQALSTQSSTVKHKQYQRWLADVQLLKCLSKPELRKLSEVLEEADYDRGEVIIQQGEPGEHFYILAEGTCSAYIETQEGLVEVKTYRQKGQYFGEIALLTDEARKATIKATNKGATVLSISKEIFSAVLGPVQDALRKNLDQYQHVAAKK
eukprot:gb/GFBE01017603.1/.p1 GENE.gb/GFBE01017603.1/~~gb/GFBE01017603.1/.p1  ORF type:complete len:471 (+),score=91.19 gb/GFBE01017603.1/:1-1413(+)